MAAEHKVQFLSKFEQSLKDDSLVKLTMSAYRGTEPQLKQLIIRKIQLKIGDQLSFVYRYTTKDITKNVDVSAGVNQIRHIMGQDFHSVHLFTTTEDLSLEFLPDKRTRLKSLPASTTVASPQTHDKQKEYIIPAAAPFLHKLGITSASGQVLADKYDKFRQINKFIEHLSSVYLSSSLKDNGSLTAYDFGSGKSYLTFAAYYFFTTLQNKHVTMTGVDTNESLIEQSNQTAMACNYTGLSFKAEEIKTEAMTCTDIVLALHACDTATDDAIAQAVKGSAQIIVVAPCCHKYVRQHMQSPSVMRNILKHGILAQRESDIITDGLRALTLEYYGYKTHVFEFISAEHTPKNILLTAVKTSETKPELLEEIKEIKSLYNLNDFYLDQQLSLL